jgi:hypothetical protein
MTRKIMEMAREAGLHIATDVNWMPIIGLEYAERFAKLVREDERNRTWTPENWTDYERSIAAAEREAIARFCETNQVWVGRGKRGFTELGEDEFVNGGIHQGMDYAAAIRARKTHD